MRRCGWGQRILTDITVDFPTGAITLVIGAPGSGKSTLLQTLAGLLPVASGRIEVDGTPLWNGRSPNKAALLQLGMVFQHPEDQLFCATVEKELRYSLRPYHLPDTAASAAIRNSLAAVDLPDEMLHRFPLTLSGGQKRRVALACTWAPEPRWLLLDEPTAGIDPRASAHLLQVLAERRRGRADGGAVIATHDLNPLLPLADWVLVLYEGRLIFAGTPETLVERPEVLELAEVGLPTALTVAQALQARGITLGSTPLTPRAVAAELMRARNQARSPPRSRRPLQAVPRLTSPLTFRRPSRRPPKIFPRRNLGRRRG
ncbi:energy-coupling factor transporter ATP-binding protein EcfA2 [Alicyclobacillus contaminans]|nr:energy-coupling factor transporter ATP-binding protein EcfA2 [Alicyclobacillus contaminans]